MSFGDGRLVAVAGSSGEFDLIAVEVHRLLCDFDDELSELGGFRHRGRVRLPMRTLPLRR
jgi:hypothetical protein